MSAQPFHPIEPSRPKLRERLLRAAPRRAALVELVNVLAACESLEEVTPSRLEEIGERHGVRLGEAFPGEMEALYRDFLLHCLSDRRLSEGELAEAEHLSRLLGIPAERCDVIQRQVARAVFLGSVEEVLSDGTVDPCERAFLDWLRLRLGIPEDTARNMVELRERRSKGPAAGS